MPSGSIPRGHCFPIGVGVELFDNIEELPNKSTLTLIVQYLVTGAGGSVLSGVNGDRPGRPGGRRRAARVVRVDLGLAP